MPQLEFYKIHGAGNDFVFMDGRSGLPENIESLAIKLCERRLSIGGNGLIFLKNSNKADFEMHYSNSDGSVATCGNGIRCLARYIEILGLWEKNKSTLSIDTVGGIVVVERTSIEGIYKMNMGSPRFDAKEIPFAGVGEIIKQKLRVEDLEFEFSSVSMGNPHCVIFVDDIKKIPLEIIGPKIVDHPSFPEKTNVEFVQIISRNHVKMIVCERGAGITLACGTGNCAILAIGVREGRFDRKISLEAPGGEFQVEWSEQGDIFLTGPTEIAFSGTVLI